MKQGSRVRTGPVNLAPDGWQQRSWAAVFSPELLQGPVLVQACDVHVADCEARVARVATLAADPWPWTEPAFAATKRMRRSR